MPPDELTRVAVTPADDPVVQHLLHGEVELVGRMPWSSNGTYLCEVRCGDADAARRSTSPARASARCGTSRRGLDQREVAAYELSRALGWDLVPVTVRREGPLGLGSLQDFVDADFEQHYFTLYEDEANHPTPAGDVRASTSWATTPTARAATCLLGLDGRIRGIDHGLMFHHEFKLRTVIWEFGGEAVPAGAPRRPQPPRRRRPARPTRRCSSTPFERDAVLARARALVDAGLLPDRRDGPPLPLAAGLIFDQTTTFSCRLLPVVAASASASAALGRTPASPRGWCSLA